MIKETYKPGHIVELIHMDDKAAPPVGTRGTIVFVDAIGTIHVLWKGYGFLGLIYGVDKFKIVEEKEDGS
jgi:hypothetical protein